MKEIKFRGKIIKKEQQGNELDWIYGDLVRELKTGKTFILDLSHFDNKTRLEEVLVEVIQESIGQFTGRKDKKGKEIYEDCKEKLECPSCGSTNTREYELQSHDNPDDEPVICYDCGYGT